MKKTGPEVMHLHKRGIYSRHKKPHVGRCDVCGRVDLASDFTFHYSPEPCGLPCAGGPAPKTKEDAPEGVHSSRNCPKKCGLKAASA